MTPVSEQPRVLPHSDELVPVTICQRGSSVVTIIAHFPFGSRHDPPALLGAAHLLEHLLLRRPLIRRGLPLPEAIERLGGEVNAATAREDLLVYARVPADRAREALELVAEVALPSELADDLIEQERAVVLEELHALETEPEHVSYEALHAAIFGELGLGQPVAGCRKAIASLDAGALLQLALDRVHRQALAFTLVGDIDRDEALLALSRAGLDDLPASGWQPSEARTQGSPPPAGSVERLLESQVAFGQLGLPAFAYGHPLRHAADLLAQLVGGGTTSLLFERVRSQRGLVYSIDASHRAYSDSGLFRIEFAVRPEKARQTFEAIREALADKLALGWTDDEIVLAREQRRGSVLLEWESGINLGVLASRMRRLAAVEAWTPERELEAIEAVTAERVRAAADQLLAEPSWQIYAGPPLAGSAD